VRTFPLLSAALVGLALLAGCAGDPQAEGTGDSSSDPTAPAPAGWEWSDDGHGLDLVTGSGVEFGLAEFAVAPRNGSAFLVGGFTDAGGGSPTVVLVRFDDPESGIVIPAYPLPVHHAQAVVVGHWLYVFGGYVSGALLPGSFVAGAGPAGWPQTPLAFRMDLASGGVAWEPIASLPETRAAGGAVVVDGQVVLAGGYGLTGGFLPSVLRYDPATDSYEELAPLPTPRDHLTLLEHGGLVYAVAGRVNRGGQWDDLEAFEVYDPASDAWTALPPVPLGRGGQAAAFVGDVLVVAGGERAEGSFDVFDDAHAYDLATGAWSELPPLPEPRHGGGLVAFDGSAYYLGGARLDGSLASETLRLAPVPAPASAAAPPAGMSSTTG
jgi:hypothetical protein